MSEPTRKRAPGAGRPRTGRTRTANLPRVSAAHHAKLQELAKQRGESLADTLEHLIDSAPVAEPS